MLLFLDKIQTYRIKHVPQNVQISTRFFRLQVCGSKASLNKKKSSVFSPITFFYIALKLLHLSNYFLQISLIVMSLGFLSNFKFSLRNYFLQISFIAISLRFLPNVEFTSIFLKFLWTHSFKMFSNTPQILLVCILHRLSKIVLNCDISIPILHINIKMQLHMRYLLSNEYSPSE